MAIIASFHDWQWREDGTLVQRFLRRNRLTVTLWSGLIPKKDMTSRDACDVRFKGRFLACVTSDE